MKYFDTKGRLKVEQERRIAERRTAPHDMQQSIARVGTVGGHQPKSLRVEIAIEAMKALIIRSDGALFPEQIVGRAYDYADAMMDAGKEEEP